MRKFARILALLYAALVGLAVLWAWYTDVRQVHTVREHMLPDMLLSMVSLPLSNTLTPLYEHSPTFFSAPLVQLTWLSVCGAFQAGVLYLISALVPKTRVAV
jgi:hypothetical protein